MPSPARKQGGRRRVPLATALAVALILLGALVGLLPRLTKKRLPVAEIPTPAALFQVSPFALAPHERACMFPIVTTSNSELAQFQLWAAKAGSHSVPPVEILLSAPGYRATGRLPGGFPGGVATVAISPPKQSLIATVCFVNPGPGSVLLYGTTEPRTLANTATQLDGSPVPGDIALSFLQSHPRSLLDSAGEVFDHASNLTDRLVPVWLIWVLAVILLLGVPSAIVVSFDLALRQDEAAGEA